MVAIKKNHCRLLGKVRTRTNIKKHGNNISQRMTDRVQTPNTSHQGPIFVRYVAGYPVT